MRFCENPTNRPISTLAHSPPHGSRIIRLIRARAQPVPAYTQKKPPRIVPRRPRQRALPFQKELTCCRFNAVCLQKKNGTHAPPRTGFFTRAYFFLSLFLSLFLSPFLSRFYFFHAQPFGFVSSSSVRGALSFLKVVNVSSAHPLISPSGASSNQAFIIALIHSNFFPSKRCREKDAPRGILSKYL